MLLTEHSISVGFAMHSVGAAVAFIFLYLDLSRLFNIRVGSALFLKSSQKSGYQSKFLLVCHTKIQNDVYFYTDSSTKVKA